MGLLDDLAVALPVVAAPMAGGPTTPALVVAAGRAGALGFLAGGYRTVEDMAAQVEEVRASGVPFGVNLFVPPVVPVDPVRYTSYRAALAPIAERFGVELPPEPREDEDLWPEKLEWLVAHRVPVVSTTFGLPAPEVIARLQRVGTKVVITVTSLDEAREAEAAGADALVVQSPQAGGHSGTWTPHIGVPTLDLVDLVAAVRAVVDLPLWAAGGVADPERLAAVLAAGAEAAQVGTALLRTDEAGTSAPYRAALADPSTRTTLTTQAFSGRPAGALSNEFTRTFDAVAPLGNPALHHLTSPIRRAAAAAGDPEWINLWAGAGYRQTTAAPVGEVLRTLAGQPS